MPYPIRGKKKGETVMENNKRKITLYDIVAVGLLAAFVFIATFFFKIKIPTPGGSTMVKLGNGICLLAGTPLGGWRGGRGRRRRHPRQHSG